MDLPPQPIIFELACKLFALEPVEDISDPTGGLGQHRPARYPQC